MRRTPTRYAVTPMADRKARRHDKRMAVVTANWEQERHVRTAQEVLERLHRDPEGRRRKPRSDKAPRPQNKRVAASVTKSHAEGIAEMFDEAQRRNPDGKRRNVVLVDGDEKQIDYVEAEAHKRQVSITLVLDLIHVIHYLWTVALLLFGGVHREADVWVGHIVVQLLTRHPLDVVATIRQTATHRRLKATDRKALDAAVEYLHKNSIYIHYAAFLADGLPIATGVIEGACRYLVQDRMGITGARWGLAMAEAVLKLRAIRTSGDRDAYWCFHLEKEHARNYPNATQLDHARSGRAQGERILFGLICGQPGLQELEQVSVAPGGELALGLDALFVSPFALSQVHRDLAEQREVFGAMVGSDA